MRFSFSGLRLRGVTRCLRGRLTRLTNWDYARRGPVGHRKVGAGFHAPKRSIEPLSPSKHDAPGGTNLVAQWTERRMPARLTLPAYRFATYSGSRGPGYSPISHPSAPPHPPPPGLQSSALLAASGCRPGRATAPVAYEPTESGRPWPRQAPKPAAAPRGPYCFSRARSPSRPAIVRRKHAISARRNRRAPGSRWPRRP
jgi:hypothetical protein